MSIQAESNMQLTPRQLQLLKIIASYQLNKCYSPTIAEIAGELGISRSTVFGHLSELRAKGLLSDSPAKIRSLKLTCEAQKLLSRLDPGEQSVRIVESSGIPLAGRIAAGEPLEAVENADCISLSSCFGVRGDIFALEVAGDSMIDEDIRSGDYVICKRAPVAENGRLVVAIVDEGRATLKRFYKEKDRVRLQPANDNYQPLYCDNCRIEAVVVGLVRKF